MSKKTITWLHLSDLHTCSPKTGWDSNRVLETLETDLKYMEQAYKLQPDFIIFTGDAAFGQISDSKGLNLKDQFHDAEHFFERIRNIFDRPVPQKRFYIVPGNHDIDRTMTMDDQVQWLRTQNSKDAIIKMINSADIQ